MSLPPDLPAKEDILNAQTSGMPDLSPAVTTIAFDPVLPLLRVPTPAGQDDDPSKGPYVLAFKDEASWRRAWRACEEQITAQCEAVARRGCSVSASKACRPPWWKAFFSFSKSMGNDMEDREACEEKAMMACLAVAKEDGVKFAKETCERVFAEMRIAEANQSIDPRFTGGKQRRIRLSRKMLPLKHTDNCPSAKLARHSVETNSACIQNKCSTNYRGKRLMGDAVMNHRPWDDKGISGDNREVSRIETNKEGWEGGLIRPKLDASGMKVPEVGEVSQVKHVSKWHEFLQEVMGNLRKVASSW